MTAFYLDNSKAKCLREVGVLFADNFGPMSELKAVAADRSLLRCFRPAWIYSCVCGRGRSPANPDIPILWKQITVQ